MMLSPLYFVTGTDTDAGKTVATAQLLRALAAAGIKAAGMKPVASGCEWRDGLLWNSDVAAHAAASGIRVPAHLACPYLFEPAISPHLAAEEAGVTTDPERIVSTAKELQTLADVVLLEGAGGWYAPLTHQFTMADLAQRLQAPVILVVGMRLGCLNHAMLSARAITDSGLKLAGWIANQIDPQMQRYAENLDYLKSHLPAPLLAEMAYQTDAQGQTLAAGAIEILACRASDKQTIK